MKDEKAIVNVFDVASYILYRLGETPTLKLHRLVYYCQAWSLVWDDAPLFTEQIKAWQNSPIVEVLFYKLQGSFTSRVKDLFGIGDPLKLCTKQIETIDAVTAYYGDKNTQWLTELTQYRAKLKR